jgi:aminoglycoside phosphotransferase (APT) family kinase protein
VGTVLTPQVEAQLRAALHAVCGRAGLDASDAHLIKYTINAVYRLASAPVVVRLGHGPSAVSRADKVVPAAAAFADLDMPTVRLHPDVDQPVTVDEWVATFWIHLPQPPQPHYRPVDLATPLRRIHTVDRLDVPLPRWDTVGDARQRLRRIPSLPSTQVDELYRWARVEVGIDLDQLLTRLEGWASSLDQQLDQITWRLPAGVIHGDARIGNLLHHPAGHLVLCDLDGVSLGQREWDLTPAALGPVRFGQHPSLYQAFADAYGFDLAGWDNGWKLLRQIRELQLVTSVIDSLHGRPAVAHQLAHRLRGILSDDDTSRWHSYE